MQIYSRFIYEFIHLSYYDASNDLHSLRCVIVIFPDANKKCLSACFLFIETQFYLKPFNEIEMGIGYSQQRMPTSFN